MKALVMIKAPQEHTICDYEWYYNVEGREGTINKIYAQINRAYEIMEKLNISEITDVFKLEPTEYDWVAIINIILEGLCLERYYCDGIVYSVSKAEKEALECNHTCDNDKYVSETGSEDEFGIGNCHLHCKYMDSDEDGFVCNKHGLWLPPSLPDGSWFAGQGLVTF